MGSYGENRFILFLGFASHVHNIVINIQNNANKIICMSDNWVKGLCLSFFGTKFCHLGLLASER